MYTTNTDRVYLCLYNTFVFIFLNIYLKFTKKHLKKLVILFTKYKIILFLSFIPPLLIIVPPFLFLHSPPVILHSSHQHLFPLKPVCPEELVPALHTFRSS